MERRLAAIVAADAVGYSRLMGSDEAGTLQAFMSDLKSLVIPKINAYRGRIVKTTGDGFLAEFVSAVSAVVCAVDIQRAVSSSVRQGTARYLAYRIGINLGEVMADADDIHGNDVNVAVRIEGLADPGGICVSGEVYRAVRHVLDLSFDDLGEQRMKNLVESVRVYRVHIPDTTPAIPDIVGVIGTSKSALRPAPGDSTSRSGRPAIAVLPFEDLGVPAKLKPLARSLARDISIDLAKYRQLIVMAINSVLKLSADSKSNDEIGRILGTRYLVLGGVQVRGNRLRVSAELVDVNTGATLWAERYDRAAGDVFAIQDAIVCTIVSALVSTVDLSERHRIAAAPTESLEAYGLYVRGREVWQQRSAEGNTQARRLFERAVALDDTFARAFGYLSFTLIDDWRNGWNGATQATLERAHQVAAHAVHLNPHDYDNQWSLAITQIYRREFDLGMSSYERALMLNPGDANLLAEMSEALILVGEAERAIEQIRRAIDLNPYHPDWYLWDLGWALYQAGRYEEALRVLRKTVDPPVVVLKDMAATLVRLGRVDEAQDVVRQILSRDPGTTVAFDKAFPFKDITQSDMFAADLRLAGLADSPLNSPSDGRHP